MTRKKIEQPDIPYIYPNEEKQTWECACGTEITVWSLDPDYPNYVNCPDCGALMNRENC